MIPGLVYIDVNIYILHLIRDHFSFNYQLYIVFLRLFLDSET